MSDTEPLEVIQSDRDAAAPFISPMAQPSRAGILAGLGDHLDIVQAFAKHRIAEGQRLAGGGGELREALARSYMYSSGEDAEGRYVKLHFRSNDDARAFMDARAEREKSEDNPHG